MSNPWSKYLVQGPPVPASGEVPNRQDVRDLTKEQIYLYFEGLKKFQAAPTDDPLSFFQIAGIHGLPYETWPNESWNTDIPEKKIDKEDWFGGFCTHSSVLFLTWHRPYLSLFESALYGHVQDIANAIDPSHPEKQTYMNYAEDFRNPYWDWARRDTQIVPEQALDPDYRVDGPPSSASTGADYNPLFAYPFVDGTSSDITMDYPTTVRYPDPQGSNDNIFTKMSEFYKRPSTSGGLPTLVPERNLSERTAYILQSYSTFVAMSANRLRTGPDGQKLPDKENWGSLEDIHNAVHNIVGGLGGTGGHMTNVTVSSFDPIFWLQGLDLEEEDSLGYAPLLFSLLCPGEGNLQIARLFLELGADVHAIGPGGMNALQCSMLLATEEIYREILERKICLLIKAGVDDNHCDYGGETPSDDAKREGCWEEWCRALESNNLSVDGVVRADEERHQAFAAKRAEQTKKETGGKIEGEAEEGEAEEGEAEEGEAEEGEIEIETEMDIQLEPEYETEKNTEEETGKQEQAPRN